MGPCLSLSRKASGPCTTHSFTKLCQECCKPPKEFVFAYETPKSIVATFNETIAFNSNGDGPVMFLDIPEHLPTRLWARPRVIGCLEDEEEVHCSPQRRSDPHSHSNRLVLNIPRYQIEVARWELKEGTILQRDRHWGRVEIDGMKIDELGTWFLGFDIEDERGSLIQKAAWCDRFKVDVRPKKLESEQELEIRAMNMGPPVWRRSK